MGIGGAYLAEQSADVQAEILAVGYDTVNGYFRSGGYAIPIAEVYAGHDVKRAECAVAAWTHFSAHGVDPDNKADSALRLAYRDSIRWLEKIATGKILPLPAGARPTDETLDYGGVCVIESDTARGW